MGAQSSVADEIEFIPDPIFGAGVWSNWTRVMLGLQEVTVDFGIRDPLERTQVSPVARITLPPSVAYELRDGLIEVMRRYTERSQPPLD